jgi:hypothetical protein
MNLVCFYITLLEKSTSCGIPKDFGFQQHVSKEKFKTKEINLEIIVVIDSHELLMYCRVNKLMKYQMFVI